MTTMRTRLLLTVLASALLTLAVLGLNEGSTIDASRVPTRYWGDADCNGLVGMRDRTLQLRALTRRNQYSQSEPCADLGLPGTLQDPPVGEILVGDLQCDGVFDAVDALAIDRVLASLAPIPVPTDCPEIGDTVTLEQPQVTYTPTPTQGPFLSNGRVVYVSVVSEDLSATLGAFYVRIRLDSTVAAITNDYCPIGMVECDSFFGESMLAAGAEALGFAPGELFLIAVQTIGDSPLELDSMVLTDTEGVPLSGTLTLLPSVARFYVRGDADCTWEIRYDDLMVFLDRLAGLEQIDCADRAEPGSGISHPQDTDCDGAITVMDFLLVLRYVADVAVDVPNCDPVGT